MLELFLCYTLSTCIIIIISEMLKSALKALVKKIQIKILYWKMVKIEEFDFLKVKILLNFMQTCYFSFP